MVWHLGLSKLFKTAEAEITAVRDELKRHVEGLCKKLQSWERAGTLQSVENGKSVVQRDIDTFHNLEMKTFLKDTFKKAESQHTQLQNSRRATQEMDQKQEEQNTQTENCLPDLWPTDARDDIRRIADTKQGLFPGASNWSLNSDDLLRWHDANHTQPLWIKGNPGTGKTIFANTIVEELESKRLASPALSSRTLAGTSPAMPKIFPSLAQPNSVSFVGKRTEGPLRPSRIRVPVSTSFRLTLFEHSASRQNQK